MVRRTSSRTAARELWVEPWCLPHPLLFSSTPAYMRLLRSLSFSRFLCSLLYYYHIASSRFFTCIIRPDSLALAHEDPLDESGYSALTFEPVRTAHAPSSHLRRALGIHDIDINVEIEIEDLGLLKQPDTVTERWTRIGQHAAHSAEMDVRTEAVLD